MIFKRFFQVFVFIAFCFSTTTEATSESLAQTISANLQLIHQCKPNEVAAIITGSTVLLAMIATYCLKHEIKGMGTVSFLKEILCNPENYKQCFKKVLFLGLIFMCYKELQYQASFFVNTQGLS